MITEFLEKRIEIVGGIFSILLIGIAILYWSVNTSPLSCVGAGDCVKYTEMAHMFASGMYGPIEYPFNIRIAAPWIASQLPVDITTAFIWLNAVSSLLFVIFLFLTARALNLSTISYMIILIWFFLHPIGFHLYYTVPISVDPLAYTFMGLITYLFVMKKSFLMWLVLFVSLFVKESFAFVAILICASELSYIFFARFHSVSKAIISVLAVVCILFVYGKVKMVMQDNLFPQTQAWEITALSTVDYWLSEAINDPNRIIVWIAAFFVATGFHVSFLVGSKWGWVKKVTPDEARVFAYFGLGCIGYVALGLVAGSDMSRIIFNGNLFVIMFFLLISKKRRLSFGYVSSVSMLSLMFAMVYTKYFPSTIEYAYYSAKTIMPLVWFVMMSAFAVIVLSMLNQVLNKEKI